MQTKLLSQKKNSRFSTYLESTNAATAAQLKWKDLCNLQSIPFTVLILFSILGKSAR